MSDTQLPNDFFQLYDLRVEVVCPEGKRILCGAKEGDHFSLQGEMLYLPAGQGISLYSLGRYITFMLGQFLTKSSCYSSTSACEAAYDACQ